LKLAVVFNTAGAEITEKKKRGQRMKSRELETEADQR
jgi:hypothetical protein